MKNLILLGIGLGLALLAKAVGRFAATVHLVDPTGSRWTIARHLGLIARLFGAALVIALVVLAVFLVPSTWAAWAVPIGLIALMVGNLSLGGLSGTSESLGTFLRRCIRWNEIEQLLEMKKRTLKVLRRYLVLILMLASALFLSPGVLAAGSCAIVIDPTVSVDSVGRQTALSLIKSTIFHYIETKDCASLVVVTMGREPRFSKRTTLKVVRSAAGIDCDSAPPVQLVGEAALFGWSKNVAEAAQREGVERCTRSRSGLVRAQLEERDEFLRALDTALTVEPTVDYSPITSTVAYLARGGLYTSVVFITDLLDNPPASLDGVAVPDGVSVVLIAVEPDPKYGTVKAVLARAGAWGRVRNVTVVTVNELQAGFWSPLRAAR